MFKKLTRAPNVDPLFRGGGLLIMGLHQAEMGHTITSGGYCDVWSFGRGYWEAIRGRVIIPVIGNYEFRCRWQFLSPCLFLFQVVARP